MAQTFHDLEVILVDDNPPESRVAREPNLQRWLTERRVRLIEHDRPRNAARARNCGLKAARGDWITYLDDDDAYLPEVKAMRRTLVNLTEHCHGDGRPDSPILDDLAGHEVHDAHCHPAAGKPGAR